MARKFNVERALDLYSAHQNVRKKESLLSVDPFEHRVRRELLTEKFTILPYPDNERATVALFTARFHFPQSTTHQAVLKGLVFQLDAALENVEAQKNGLVFVYDMTNSKYHNFDYELSIKILSMLKGSYPARLKKVLIVTAPLWFKAPFRILRLFVREKLRDRVHIINLNQLPKHIPMNSLPRRLGGQLDFCHTEWLRRCLCVMAGKNANLNHDIAAFFENIDNDNVVEGDRESLPGSVPSSLTSTPNGDDNSFRFSSDLESDGSTIQEKHSDEDREKEVSVEKDSMRSPHIQSRGSSPTRKRTSESHSPVPPGENPLTKKRPTADMNTWEESIHTSEPGGMTPAELVENVKVKGRRGLIREYCMLKHQPPAGTFDVSKARYNLPKNRYTDVLCLDQTRVRLSPIEGDPSSDYINANFVDGYKQKKAYISTQGPLPKTFPDFWRMIWEQQVLVVVMTTRTVERGKVKCGQYWPAEEETAKEYGDFVVINSGTDCRKDYTISLLILQNSRTGQTREVTHFQFTNWHDYTAPDSAESFLHFLFDVRRRQAQKTAEIISTWPGHPLGPPIVVHCSAGIGRTGTFITTDISTKRLADIGTVDIHSTVQRIRSHRAFSIQMPDQYVFCHLALIEHAQREGLLGQVDLRGFADSSSESD